MIKNALRDNSKTMGKLADYLVKEYAKLDPKNETYYKKNGQKNYKKFTDLSLLKLMFYILGNRI